MIREAWISDCGLFRYTLLRVWDQSKPILTWCMLNPSKADAEDDDPTVRKVIGSVVFSRRAAGRGGDRGDGKFCAVFIYVRRD